MKEKMKQMRLNVTLSAILTLVVGALLLFFPAASISAMGRVIALIITAVGILIVIGQFLEFDRNVPGIIVGLVLAFIGLWIFASPAAILSIIPIAIGIVMLVHGIRDLCMAVEGSKYHVDKAWLPYLLAIVNIILGLVCIGHSFGVVNMAFRIIGLMLIFDGLTDLGIVHGVKKASKDVVDSTITSEEDIF